MLSRLLRFGFNLLYNQLACAYDLVAWIVSLGHWRSWQGTALPYLQGNRILEIAFGTGSLQIELAARGFTATGIDLSPAMCQIARRKIMRAAHGSAPTRIRLIRSRAQALPFSAAAFSSIVATFPAEFFADPTAIAEFSRVLEPGGALVIVLGAAITGPSPTERLMRQLFRLTGQIPDATSKVHFPLNQCLESYAHAGLPARLELVTLPHSVVYVIVGRKQTARPGP